MVQTRLFISYSRKDSGFAHQLAKDLRAAGYDVWIDISGLRGGQTWARGIDAAVRDCDAFLVIASPDSLASEWVGKETLLAQSLKKLIIPVMLREATLPVHLIDLHWVDFRREYDEAVRALIEALAPLGARPPQPTSTEVSSPDTRVKKRLSRLPAWAWGISALVVIAAVIAGGFFAGLWELPTPMKEAEPTILPASVDVTPSLVTPILVDATPDHLTPALARGLVVDNLDPGFSIEAGYWGICSDGDCGGICYGEDMRWAGPGCTTCRARFDFEVPAAGEHDLWTWWPRGEGDSDDRATDTSFVILRGNTPITVTVNQKDFGSAWYPLGTFAFEAGESASIVVMGSETGFANADAIAVTPAGDRPPGADLSRATPANTVPDTASTPSTDN